MYVIPSIIGHNIIIHEFLSTWMRDYNETVILTPTHSSGGETTKSDNWFLYSKFQTIILLFDYLLASFLYNIVAPLQGFIFSHCGAAKIFYYKCCLTSTHWHLSGEEPFEFMPCSKAFSIWSNKVPCLQLEIFAFMQHDRREMNKRDRWLWPYI